MTELHSFGIFCDDIRQEVSGKYILVGVYSGDLISSVVPFTVFLSCILWITGLPAGDNKFKVRIILDGAEIQEINGLLPVADDSENANILLSGFPVNVVQEGLLEAKLEIAGEKLDVVRLPLKQGTN